MIQPAVAADVVDGAEGAGLGVARAIVDLGDAGADDRADAHHARFNGDVKRGVGEAVLTEMGGGVADGDNLGVRGRIAERDREVVADARDALVDDDESADRDFAFMGGAFGFFECDRHRGLAEGGALAELGDTLVVFGESFGVIVVAGHAWLRAVRGLTVADLASKMNYRMKAQCYAIGYGDCSGDNEFLGA